MSISEFIKPVNNQHSIKEAIITIFLSTPIVDPQTFEHLLKEDFSKIFNTFEVLEQHKVEIKPKTPAPDYVKIHNSGFIFMRKDEGELKYVMQGVNEDDRTFLSFHTLVYSRWQAFFDLFRSCVDVIAKKHSEFQIEAFNLHYIDEFRWIQSDNPDLALIFNKNNDYLPKSFFAKSFPKIDLVFTTNSANEFTYFDRINISILPTIQPTIIISHLGSYQLNIPKNINDLLEHEFFVSLITKAHIHNKELLNELLTIEVKELIHLTNH